MPFEVSANSLRNPGWATSPSSLQSPPRGTRSPKGSGSGPVPAAVQHQKSHWPDEMLMPQAHPIHFTRETTEKPWSHLEYEETHTWQKPIYIKFERIKEVKAFQVFKCYKKNFFFCHFSGTYFFCFYCFFFLVWSHKPTEKGLEKLIFQGGNGRRTSFFFFLKKCS